MPLCRMRVILNGPLACLTCLCAALVLLSATAGAEVGTHPAALVPQTWQMLDYMAADYPGAVREGTVIDTGEYQEMLGFSKAVTRQIGQLPSSASKGDLERGARQFESLIAQKASKEAVSKQAHRLASRLLDAYPVPTAPSTAPDGSRGAQLYAQHCASCHGEHGAADGPAAMPEMGVIALNDPARADGRSPLSYYQTVTQGVDGTAMPSFSSDLDASARWDVAYYAGTLAYRDGIAAGRTLWANTTYVRSYIGSLDELSRTRAAQLVPVIGMSKARDLVGFLRANPSALEDALEGIPLARGRLNASVTAYAKGENRAAVRLALSSYLDGVEPIEPALDTKNRGLRQQIELQMGVYRTRLSQGAPVDSVRAQAHTVDGLLEEAGVLLATHTTGPATIFLGAFTILTREGLEALLVIVALIALLTKADRREYLRYVHMGWILALIAGVGTWFVARYAIEISGASRELTEGLSSLFAAAVLLGVGLWMHQKSIGGRWQAYIREKMSAALDTKSAWLLFVLAFVTVYREMFETILFYVAIWEKSYAWWFIAGIASALVVLAIIAWALLGTSRRLPVGRFFQASTVLIAVLAFVLVGKGVASLQEAGWIGVRMAPIAHIDILGVYPTWQTSAAQLAVVVLLCGGFVYNRWSVKTERDGNAQNPMG